VVLAGELVNRHYLGGQKARPARMVLRGWPRFRRRSPLATRRSYFRHTSPDYVFVWQECEGKRFGALAEPFLANPVWIALTAPARWLIDRIRPRAGHGRRRGNGNGPPGAGVREPRRPRPDQPAGAMALPEPF
jgi:hypothetical protein